MDEKELIFLGAAIWLAPRMGQISEATMPAEIQRAVTNAHKLLDKVKEHSDKNRAELRTDGVMEAEKRLAGKA